MKRYTTVIFDCDGTILNTLDDLMDSMNYILKNIIIQLELYLKFVISSATASVNW